MTKKIFRSICLVALLVFVSSIVLIMSVLYDYFSDIQFKQLKIQTNLISQSVTNEGVRYFDGLDFDSYRITWIRHDGEVLYDSSLNTSSSFAHMENHLERTEIRQALADGFGQSDRYSATLMERSFYCAKRLDDGSVLRLSATHGTILILLLGMSQPIFLVFAIAIVLSVVLAARLSNNIVKPFNTLDLENPLETAPYEELSPLLLRISSQQNQLKLKETQLRQKQEELYAIISNMKEGIILLSSDGTILSINRAAVSFLNIETTMKQNLSEKCCIGKKLSDISCCQTLLHAADNVLCKNPQELTTPLRTSHYQITASPVFADTTIFGAALLLLDITEKEKAEQMRRMHLEPQDLFETASSAIRSLSQEAADADVTVTLSGQPAIVNGIPQLLFGIVFNLCDNAIKYNKKGGSVFISILSDAETVSLTVRDTGIGISTEHQEHIFERFYRVDKSHSKQLGGTGLGLSIVKHAAKIHHADIMLQSVPGSGTTIMVTFPKHEI